MTYMSMTYESGSHTGYGGCEGSLRSKKVRQESGLEETLRSLILDREEIYVK